MPDPLGGSVLARHTSMHVFDALLPNFDALRRPFMDKRPPKDHPILSQELLDPQKWFTYQNLRNFTRKAARIFSRRLLR